MIQKLEAKGVKGEGASWEWDDGSDHDDVTKIYVRYGLKGIRYIYFDYVKSGQLKEGAFHGLLKSGCTQIFEINHLKDEHLEAVEGYYTESDGIQALRFRTNFKTSELMGSDDKGTKFSLEVNGKKIVGFHGSRNSSRLNSLGAYFTWITPTKLEAKGGKGGKEWNDGYDHDNLTKIHIHGGAEGIQFIRFSYVKNRQVEEGPIHGFDGQGFTQTFEINHLNNEYLVTVDGYYDASSGVIQGLQFKTNIKTFKMMGYEKGRKFSVAANGNKIIGFHGYSETSGLHSLGAYFTTDPPSKLDCLGLIGPFSVYWDDGSNYDGIRKVFVNVSTSRYVTCIRFEYENGGKFEKVHRRDDVQDEKEFALEYPYEFITSMEMSIKGNSATDKWISSLKIKTSKGRSSPTFGKLQSTKVVLEKKDNALVGFYGWSTSTTLNALGAYYRPLPPPSNAKTLKAEGGDGGVSWDDGGNFDGVRKIFIGLSHNAVAFVKFMYYKDARMIFGDDHGSKTLFEDEEFELNYPDEYLISVEGASNSSGVITMLRFKTNKQTSPAFGFGTTSSFLLHDDDHIIVGFHGRSDNMLLHQIGVHVTPISNHIHI